MSGFLYYVSGIQATSADDIRRVGLDSVIGEGGFSFREVSPGPDKKVGCVIARNNSRRGIGYYPDRQTWRQGKCFWVGIDNEDKPTPKDLERPEMLWGHKVRLGDNQEWQIPIAHAVDKRMILGNDGQWESGAALERFDVLNEHAEKIWSVLFTTVEENANSPIITNEEGAGMCVHALALNYYVGPQEVDLLGVLTSRNVQTVLKAIVDLPTIIELSKKKEGVERMSSGGSV